MSAGAAAAAAMGKHHCSWCRAGYAEADWVRLPITERVTPSEVRRLVRDWPDEVCIEVRCCGRCGRPIAAKRPT